MGKLIAVCGSAGSGKTTFSVKFAETLYHRSHGKHSVIALFCDIVTPSIPVIFPNRKEEDLFSVGSVLSKTDFYADDVVSHMMMTKDRMNLGYLGYLSGENKNSFPEYKDVRAKNFLDVLCGISDYVIVDCMTMPGGNILTTSALEKADHTIRLMTPDLACMSYYMSQGKMLAAEGYMRESDIKVMNIPHAELVSLASGTYPADFLLPYSTTLTEQYLEGRLSDPLKDKKYLKIMNAIAERAVH